MWTGLQVREQTEWQVCHCSNCELWVFQIFTTLLKCWEIFQITILAHHNYSFKKLRKMTWAWGSRQERGERDRWEGGVERARERMKERKKKKEASELFFHFSSVFSRSIKMYWALKQQPKSSSKLYVKKTGIIPQVSTMIYLNMNESWFWQSSIYLMKNLLKRKKKV